MPDYKESITIGEMKQWRRAENVVISNPFRGLPTITFNEENMICLGDATYLPGPGVTDPTVSADFTDPAKEFNLINPADGVVIGSAKYMDVYVLLWSLYAALAVERDAAILADALAAQEQAP